jgi:hypothetical protein
MKDLWLRLTLLLIKIGIRGSSCLRIYSYRSSPDRAKAAGEGKRRSREREIMRTCRSPNIVFPVVGPVAVYLTELRLLPVTPASHCSLVFTMFTSGVVLDAFVT